MEFAPFYSIAHSFLNNYSYRRIFSAFLVHIIPPVLVPIEIFTGSILLNNVWNILTEGFRIYSLSIEAIEHENLYLFINSIVLNTIDMSSWIKMTYYVSTGVTKIEYFFLLIIQISNLKEF